MASLVPAERIFLIISDWAEYKEFQICMCLRRFADMWRERGVRLPFYQNTGYHYYTPVDNIRIERECVDICGIDMYPNRTALKPIREKIRYMSGSSILPFVPEYGSGVWFEFPETFLPEVGGIYHILCIYERTEWRLITICWWRETVGRAVPLQETTGYAAVTSNSSGASRIS